MFEIAVAPEFESWFQSLDLATAEHVASALDLLESSGPALDGVRASRLLLWYDGMCSAEFGSKLPSWLAGLDEATAGLRRLAFWREEALRWLESPHFLNRLAELDGIRAQHALRGVEQVRRLLRSALVWGPYLGRTIPYSSSSAANTHPSSQSALETQGRRGDSACEDSVKDSLFELLSLVGFNVDPPVDPPSGLREIAILDTSPRLRVIYGIDIPNQRILAILGEALHRAYYGESVRLCEQRWQSYCKMHTFAVTTP